MYLLLQLKLWSLFFTFSVICSPFFYVESHIATVSASISSNDNTWAKRNFNLLLPLIYYKFVPIICVNFICLPLQCHVHASTSKNVFKECHAFKRLKKICRLLKRICSELFNVIFLANCSELFFFDGKCWMMSALLTWHQNDYIEHANINVKKK